MTTTATDVRGAPADGPAQSPDPGPELVRVPKIGMGIAMRLARAGVFTLEQVYSMDEGAIAKAAGVDAERAQQILLAVEAVRTGGGMVPGPGGKDQPALVAGAEGFQLAPHATPNMPRNLDPKEIARRVRLMERRRGDRTRGALSSARMCPECGVILSYPRPHAERARLRGEAPSHGSKFSFAVHMCEKRGSVSAGDAPRALRERAASLAENDVVFEDYAGVE